MCFDSSVSLIVSHSLRPQTCNLKNELCIWWTIWLAVIHILIYVTITVLPQILNRETLCSTAFIPRPSSKLTTMLLQQKLGEKMSIFSFYWKFCVLISQYEVGFLKCTLTEYKHLTLFSPFQSCVFIGIYCSTWHKYKTEIQGHFIHKKMKESTQQVYSKIKLVGLIQRKENKPASGIMNSNKIYKFCVCILGFQI